MEFSEYLSSCLTSLIFTFRYYRNDTSEDGNSDPDSSTFTLTFTLTFPHENDIVYLAHCFPYTYSDLQDDMAAIQVS